MKNIQFLLLLLTIASSAMAQTEKGRWLIGAQVGNVSYQKFKNDGGHNFTVDANPSAGYFPVNNLLIGVALPFSSNQSSYNSPVSASGPHTWSLGLGPFIRYYAGRSSLKPYLGVSYTYSRSRTIYKNVTSTDRTLKGHTFNLAPTLGLAYFINRNVLLSAGLSYNITQSSSEVLILTNPPAVTDFTFNTRKLSLDVGFAVLLGQ
ncbi:hypothetical protein GCM10027299_14130 [Larkinella ripae]